MKVINSKGRVLLEVTGAVSSGFAKDGSGFENVTYSYRGPGMGGNVDIVGLHRTIECVKLDNPSAKIEGLLPEPRIVAWAAKVRD
jgi:hypothetical protein